MKKFYLAFVLSFLGCVCGVSALSAFTGCATLRDHSATVNLVISQAVLRYIDEAPPALRNTRAAEVLKVVSQIEKLTDGDEITVTELAAVAASYVPDSLSVADRQLALGVINIASQELRKRIGEGVLKPDQLSSVRDMLQAIRDAANIYIEG